MQRELIRTPTEYENWKAALDRDHPKLQYEKHGVTFAVPAEYPFHVYFCVYENHHNELELDYWLEPVLPAISKEAKYVVMTHPAFAHGVQVTLHQVLQFPGLSDDVQPEDVLAILTHKLYLYRLQEAKKQS